MKLKLLIISLLALTNVWVAHAAEHQTPNKLCNLINQTMILTAECKVDEQKMTLSLKMDLNKKEATMLCHGIRFIGQGNGWVLDAGWKIQVNSKQNSNGPIAECSYEAGKHYYS